MYLCVYLCVCVCVLQQGDSSDEEMYEDLDERWGPAEKEQEKKKEDKKKQDVNKKEQKEQKEREKKEQEARKKFKVSLLSDGTRVASSRLGVASMGRSVITCVCVACLGVR